jgi:transposase
MGMLAEHVDAVIGVDTHRDTQSACLVNRLGGELATLTASADADGYARLLAWAVAHTPGPRLVWAVEGTRSHGAGLTRALRAAGQQVVESDRPKRVSRRPGGKSDPIDARRAAREALARKQQAWPRVDGPREAARMLLVTRESAVLARTAAVNQLKALVLTAPDVLRQRLRDKTTPALVLACQQLRPTAATAAEDHARRTAMQRLARRIRDLTAEIRAADRELLTLIRAHVPQLLDLRGVGPIGAAQAWISWSEPGRCRSEAAFAALAGVNPIPASSGTTVRYRLNRHGDRALNRSLHQSVLTLERCDPATQAYIARRVASGKTRPEARRCLKRYLARKIYRRLEHPPPSSIPA